MRVWVCVCVRACVCVCVCERQRQGEQVGEGGPAGELIVSFIRPVPHSDSHLVTANHCTDQPQRFCVCVGFTRIVFNAFDNKYG